MSDVRKSELIFLYDLAWANPNGDPNDANKPRIDSETGINIVTDVRLKRTIRDELIARKDYTVLIQDSIKEDGTLADAKYRASQFMPERQDKKAKKLTEEEARILDENIKKCIDVRLFGCTLPYQLIPNDNASTGSVTYTGPVQFKMGYSLHPVKLEFIKGTGAFASSEGKEQKTFRQEYVLPYSLINFYGIINDRAAQMTGLSESDIEIMLDAMWEGTKNLISRTKVGQTPRLLIRVSYKQPDFYIGSLDKAIGFTSPKEGEAIRDITDGILVLQNLADRIIEHKEKIDAVEIKMDQQIICDINLVELLNNAGITVKRIS